jgi:hypothetical protein
MMSHGERGAWRDRPTQRQPQGSDLLGGDRNRYDKLEENFLAALKLAAHTVWHEMMSPRQVNRLP